MIIKNIKRILFDELEDILKKYGGHGFRRLVAYKDCDESLGLYSFFIYYNDRVLKYVITFRFGLNMKEKETIGSGANICEINDTYGQIQYNFFKYSPSNDLSNGITLVQRCQYSANIYDYRSVSNIQSHMQHNINVYNI